MDKPDAKRVAQKRHEIHLKAGNFKPTFAPDYLKMEHCGVVGEMEFAKKFGIPFDYDAAINKVHGDEGIDFVLDIGTVDVKGSESAGNLICPVCNISKIKADFLVLAKVIGNDAILLGWAFRESLIKAPIKNFGFSDCHYIPLQQLRTIQELKLLNKIAGNIKEIFRNL